MRLGPIKESHLHEQMTLRNVSRETLTLLRIQSVYRTGVCVQMFCIDITLSVVYT